MPSLKIRLYALSIQYDYTEYGLDTKGQQCEETSPLSLDQWSVYELKHDLL
jgi:hypothetical protein